MARAAALPLPYPEAVVVEEESPAAQAVALALDLPERPVVLGGCCYAHVGAVEALAARHGRISVVWVDAHGDLNTVESSPSGNPWATPLRVLIDSGAVAPADVVLLGARALDPPEERYIAERGVRVGADAVAAALEDTAGTYVAIDFDGLSADEVVPFMPEPGGIPLAEAERLADEVRSRSPVLGAGISGLAADERNVEPATRVLAALGL